MSINDIIAFASATNGELYDTDDGWMIEAVETQESIDDFIGASESYSERSVAHRGVIAGFPFVALASHSRFQSAQETAT